MAGHKRRTYTDADKARVYSYLVTNDFNVYRTARDTGIPENTVRDWHKQWEANGPPEAVESEAALVAADFIDTADMLRSMTMEKLLELIPKATEKNINSLTTLMGVLTDKIDRTKGLATQRVEVNHTYASLPEQAKALVELVDVAMEAVEARHQVIDAEVIEEQPTKGLLPSVSS